MPGACDVADQGSRCRLVERQRRDRRDVRDEVQHAKGSRSLLIHGHPQTRFPFPVDASRLVAELIRLPTQAGVRAQTVPARTQPAYALLRRNAANRRAAVARKPWGSTSIGAWIPTPRAGRRFAQALRARGSGRGRRRAGRGTGGGRRRAPRRCPPERRTRAARPAGVPRSSAQTRYVEGTCCQAADRTGCSRTARLWRAVLSVASSLDLRIAVLQERLGQGVRADGERAALGVDVEERGGLLAAERGEALPDLGQVAGDEQQMAHGRRRPPLPPR